MTRMRWDGEQFTHPCGARTEFPTYFIALYKARWHNQKETPQMTDITPSHETSEKLLRLEHDYTDDELLNELRRRGRLARIDADEVVPDRYVKAGYPIERQIRASWANVALEAARLHVSGTSVPTGAKIENVESNGHPFWEKGRRTSFTLNYVVDKR